jgi:hypothetical protein
MANIGTNIEAQLTKIAAWQYLNAATFVGVVVIIVILVF